MNLRINDNQGVLHTPQISRTGCSLMSYQGNPTFSGVLPLCSRYNQQILSTIKKFLDNCNTKLSPNPQKFVFSPLSQCLAMVWETRLQSQVKSYQRLKKWYSMLPCLTPSIMRYRSRVNRAIQGKE